MSVPTSAISPNLGFIGLKGTVVVLLLVVVPEDAGVPVEPVPAVPPVPDAALVGPPVPVVVPVVGPAPDPVLCVEVPPVPDAALDEAELLELEALDEALLGLFSTMMLCFLDPCYSGVVLSRFLTLSSFSALSRLSSFAALSPFPGIANWLMHYSST